MERCCCGFGHKEIYENIYLRLEEEAENAIKSGITVFLTGGMGSFDAKFSSVVYKLKSKHKNIKLILVRPYYSNKINEYCKEWYDEIIIPGIADGAFYKSAIIKRNKWMIEKSERCIFYVKREYGGAYTALKYAEKEHKTIIKI